MRSKSSKVIDIALSEEKFYFPGETIRGSVIVKPKSSIKANCINIKFSGAIFISVKDKEIVPLFQIQKSLPINNGKSKVLESKQPYKFSFEFVVPDHLPSAMDLGKSKTARIQYKLVAVLDRPMVPESLCPKIEYPVLVLEYVDVTKGNFVKSLEKQKEALTSQIKCHVKLSVPRTGFTRGETIPVNVVVNTFQSFSKKSALVIELVRKIKIQSARNTLDEEHILKSNKFDLNIIGPYNFTQSINSQLLIRPTPPTIRYKDRVLRIHYKIRAQIFTSEVKKSPTCVLELPIVIGTWPRADIPIDDDDDEDIIQNMGEVMISDDDDDEEDEEEEEIEEEEESTSERCYRQREKEDYSNNKRYSMLSLSSQQLQPQQQGGYYQQIRKSGSNGSLNSMNSWISQSTLDRRVSSSTSPTTVTSASNSINHHNMIPIDNYQRNTLPPVGFKMLNGYLNRSSSTPDLLCNPPPQQQHRTRVIDPTMSYDPPSPNYSVGHRSSKSMHTILNYSQISPPQQYHRTGSDELKHVTQNEPDVPNHTLTFLSSEVDTGAPPEPVTHPQRAVDIGSLEETSDSESDFDEDDLFGIIEKKRKQHEKEQRRQQRAMYTLVE